jgi:hypothetical protein
VFDFLDGLNGIVHTMLNISLWKLPDNSLSLEGEVYPPLAAPKATRGQGEGASASIHPPHPGPLPPGEGCVVGAATLIPYYDEGRVK